MYLLPANPSVSVPDPSREGTPDYFLPATGREVEDSLYWHRRLIDRDVVIGTPPDPTEQTSEPTA